MNGTVPAIRAEAITKVFGDLTVLRSLSLSVAPGEVVCILGPSGSGKSTLLRCLNWLSPPTSGLVWIGNQLLGMEETAGGALAPLPDAKLRRQRSRIGMVFQSFNLWPHRTAIENVTEGPRIVLRLSKQAAREKGERLLERVGLSDKQDVYPGRLSGGQQQRVAIARALAMEPEILLFDEPTSSLDPELVGEVLAVMQDLANQNTTMIVVTHEIGFAAEAADRIILMDGGTIVEEGSPKEFLHDPKEARSKQFLDQFLRRNFSISTMGSASRSPGRERRE